MMFKKMLFVVVLLPTTLLIGAEDDQADIRDWDYPGAEKMGSTASRGIVGFEQREQQNVVLTTNDPFDQVVKFYEERFGHALEPGKNLQSSGRPEVTNVLVNDSARRPVSLRIFLRRTRVTAITIVVSRAEGEAKTHIFWSDFWQERRETPPRREP